MLTPPPQPTSTQTHQKRKATKPQRTRQSMSASLQLDVFSLFETQPGDLLLRPTSVTVASTAPNPSTTTRRRTLRLRVPAASKKHPVQIQLDPFINWPLPPSPTDCPSPVSSVCDESDEEKDSMRLVQEFGPFTRDILHRSSKTKPVLYAGFTEKEPLLIPVLPPDTTSSSNKQRVFVVGVGCTKFLRPLSHSKEYHQLAKEAAAKALEDSRIPYAQVKAAVASYCYGDPSSGQRAMYELGMTGIPIFNCNSYCSSGSSAIMLGKNLVQSGNHDCVLVVGFEKMRRSLDVFFPEYENPGKRQFDRVLELGAQKELMAPQLNQFTSDIIKMFVYATREYCAKYPTANATAAFQAIAHKNHKQSQWNPNALLTKQISIEDIKNPAKSIGDPLTTAMSAPTADGAAALVLCTLDFVLEHGLQHNAVEILGQEMETDSLQTLQGGYSDVCGVYLAERASARIYKDTGITPQDIDVLEVHDCFASAELFMYEALGLAGPGEGAKLIESAEWIKSRGGIGETALLGNRWVVNPSGGLESKGHPIGASGVAQAVELSLQLRGDAGNRQILFRDPRKRVGLQHNYGLGSACVVTLYGKFDATDKSEEVSKL
ncbi:hypothetical protein HDU79_003162 [Rhizoclosmatium sp. JEL0117]|nr:hypothetical protein HDU79_003162 [Rhizoclosmatium sp. JEL0117]